MTEHELMVGYGVEPTIVTNVTTSYRGQCVTCGWEGHDRSNSLAALRDFDRHAAGHAHIANTARCDYPGCLGPADGSECRHPDPDDDDEAYFGVPSDEAIAESVHRRVLDSFGVQPRGELPID